MSNVRTDPSLTLSAIHPCCFRLTWANGCPPGIWLVLLWMRVGDWTCADADLGGSFRLAAEAVLCIMGASMVADESGQLLIAA